MRSHRLCRTLTRSVPLGWPMLALFSCLVSAAAAGCMNSQPKERLAETVHAMNQATRWGRIPSAAAMVDPEYKPTFLHSHAGWGDAVQLADSHVVQVEVSPGNTAAVALIAYSWYHLKTMRLHTTVVQQEWMLRDETYTLVSEAVIKGEPSLLPFPEVPEDDAASAPTPRVPPEATQGAAPQPLL